MTIELKYPAWHDEARAMRAKGSRVNEIADHFGVTGSRISQVTSPNWQVYQIIWRSGEHYRDMAKGAAALKAGLYSFSPIEEMTPAEKMKARASARKPPVKQEEEDPMARLRTFPEVKEIHEGKILKGALIRCSKCDATNKYFNFQGSVSTEHLPKEFSRRGWFVGKNERGDLCPTHIGKFRPKPVIVATPELPPSSTYVESEPAPPPLPDVIITPVFTQPVMEKVMDATSATKIVPPWEEKASTPPVNTAPDNVTTVTPVMKVFAEPKAAMPAEMDKMMRRLVFSRLNELYLDETKGYSGDWTDAKVAADLQVPVAWVAEVRDADFGPELNAELLVKKFSDLKELGDKVERHIVLIDKKIEQMQALDGKLASVQEGIDAQITRYDELVKNLTTEDHRIELIIKAFNTDVAAFRKNLSAFADASSPA